jgi:hypothetical protein
MLARRGILIELNRRSQVHLGDHGHAGTVEYRRIF